MTITDTPLVDAAEQTEGEKKPRKPRTRDFTKHSGLHVDLANYINEHSGIEPVTPNQVKAVLSLKTDFANTPEARLARETRKAEKEAEKSKYAGMTDDQIKAIKASRRAEAQAARLQAKAQAAMDRAKALAAEAEGSGEDLAAVFEAAGESENDEPRTRRGLRR